MSDVPGAYVEMLNAPDEVAQAWRAWYDRVCLPARAHVPGVVAARRGVGVIGSVKDLVVYDLANPGVTFSPAWQAVDREICQTQADAPEYRVQRESVVPYLFRQISSSVQGDYSPPGVDVLHMSFFVVEPRFHDELNDWYALEHIGPMLRVPGYLNMRRYQGVADNRLFIGLLDVESIEAAESNAAMAAMTSPWSDRVRSKLVTYRERRLFRVERCLASVGQR
jgi:hypothetical protein